MARILEVKDKTGRIVYLTDERYQHILKHPEMQNSILDGEGFIVTAYFMVKMA